MKRLLCAGIALAFVIGLAPLAGLAAEVMVHVGHNKLDPAEVSIAAGDTVIFHNTAEMPGGHTIVSDDGELSSPPLAKDAQWSHSFEAPGSYSFHIKQHPHAKAVVKVE
jgi:plastocyanin